MYRPAGICPQGLSGAVFAQPLNTGCSENYTQMGFITETAKRKDANNGCRGDKLFV